MKNFVKLIKQAYEERYSVVLGKILREKLPVTFFSVAPTAQAVEAAKTFRAQGLNIIALFVRENDFYPAPDEFKIISVDDAAKIFPQPEYIIPHDLTAARVAIKNFPASKVLLLGNDTDGIYKMFMTHLDDLQEVYESLVDEESKKVFRGYWLGNISLQLGKIVYSNTPHYICAGFLPERGAVVIDGGLCDGGTALRFSQMGYEVYGFEMDRENYEVARKVGEENNFVVENLGLGSFKHQTTYTHMPNPGASRLDSNGQLTATITTLDSYVREKNLPRVDFIKLDVEGAELDVLRGAATTIARFKPILALSAYHKLDDFWTLMNFVKSVRPDYEFAMRQFVISKEDGAYHFHDGLEEFLDSLGLRPALVSFGECVLFAR
ncbi:MAG: FkbM family methyltransferase [Selenomonadaceae bacterium]|nr:FkbM family methyltransferase [Selenomonadaceae bacterium]MBQ9497591.1 FkbM family methyltransferase [Selenomonadaceae bacterium]